MGKKVFFSYGSVILSLFFLKKSKAKNTCSEAGEEVILISKEFNDIKNNNSKTARSTKKTFMRDKDKVRNTIYLVTRKLQSCIKNYEWVL